MFHKQNPSVGLGLGLWLLPHLADGLMGPPSRTSGGKAEASERHTCYFITASLCQTKQNSRIRRREF